MCFIHLWKILSHYLTNTGSFPFCLSFSLQHQLDLEHKISLYSLCIFFVIVHFFNYLYFFGYFFLCLPLHWFSSYLYHICYLFFPFRLNICYLKTLFGLKFHGPLFMHLNSCSNTINILKYLLYILHPMLLLSEFNSSVISLIIKFFNPTTLSCVLIFYEGLSWEISLLPLRKHLILLLTGTPKDHQPETNF